MIVKIDFFDESLGLGCLPMYLTMNVFIWGPRLCNHMIMRTTTKIKIANVASRSDIGAGRVAQIGSMAKRLDSRQSKVLATFVEM